MTDLSPIGKLLILAGTVIIVVGLLFMFGSKIPWFGKLPGDIYIQKKSFTFFLPITTSIIVSIILTIIMMLLRRR